MILKGYVSTHLPVPVKVQNLVLRDYCHRAGHSLALADTEFLTGYHMLQGMAAYDCEGICAYSMACFPDDDAERDLILVAMEGKEIHFALEGYVWPTDAQMLETVWRLKALP
jgi:sporadic carbohydrate cluster protein (TIGR04323 family)